MSRGKSLEREQYWREVLERQAQSGLSAARFCRKQGLALPSFYAWKQKLRQRDGIPVAGIPSADQICGADSGLGRSWMPVRIADDDRQAVAHAARRTYRAGRASSTFDVVDRLTDLYNLKTNGDLISGFTYQVDGTGNRLGVVEATGQRTTRAYDATYQLTNEHRSGTGGFHTTFVYDAVGNRLVKNATGSLTTSTYDAANQLMTSVDSTGTTTYAFDSSGNQQIEQAPSGTTTNTWNFENQMALVEKSDGTRVAMMYNANFRRTKTRS